jgi:mono/diheme cytochrome c family protein
MTRTIAAMLSLSLFVAFAGSAAAADASHGEVLAKRWCAACHVVSKDQKHGNTQVPPFLEIAKKPNLTAASIALFLLRPHPPMPDMSLSRSEAADLAAYIEAQGK